MAFKYFTNRNTTALSNLVNLRFYIIEGVSSGWILEVEMMNQKVNVKIILLTAKLPSKKVVLISVPKGKYDNACFPTALKGENIVIL